MLFFQDFLPKAWQAFESKLFLFFIIYDHRW
ncbi:hypothetical protein ALFP_3507 [Alcaligenes faecalis]|nr:hypothetical protein ALFP_3507 [Alcaligenes faecalis]